LLLTKSFAAGNTYNRNKKNVLLQQ